MNSTAPTNSPEPSVTDGVARQEDWSEIWALEDPAISGVVPSDQDTAGRRDARD